ncbi:MAG TPA: ferrous iron transport protein B [Polyangiaceae bacterium]|nr:ferrous iron transport protein B [Polyangiaceae bacterium]
MTSTQAETAPEQKNAASRGASKPLVVLVGNPNTGKTTLFNRLTGQNARIGNYPGVTVERRSGSSRLDGNQLVEVVDLPGTYSLSARSAEEQIALWAVLGQGQYQKPDLCVFVADATQLARNLYLAIQLCELGLPLIIALNMIDEAGENPPNTEALSKLLGVPCLAISARRGTGMSALLGAMERALGAGPAPELRIPYSAELVRDARQLSQALPPSLRGDAGREQALSLWALTSIEEDDELGEIDPGLRRATLALRAHSQRDLDQEVIAPRYAFIDEHLPELYRRHERHPRKRQLSERADRILLHPVWGFALFVLVMLVVFQSLFSWSDPAISLIEDAFAALRGALEARLPAGIFREFLTQGLISGLGNVLVFLPQILLLFFFIGLLEDSGYMARVAYLMDRIMKSLGLHGRAFVPMLSGFACAVPAILATRTMERQRDRLLTMLVIPLMTCSARLPVYTLIIGALFPPSRVFGLVPVQGLMMVGMYLFATLMTLVTAGILGRTAVKGRRVPLILELPPYRLPSLSGTLKMMWERAWSFLREAGTVILACTVALWVLLSFPRADVHEAPSTAPAAAVVQKHAPNAPLTAEPAPPSPIAQSYGGRLGHAIEPVLKPLGFDWKIGVGLIGAFAAREVFVATLGLVYGIDETGDDATPLRSRLRAETRADGKPAYTPLMGLSLLIFFAISCQCMSTLATVKRETHSYRWPAFMFAYMTVLAYLMSFSVFQVGRLLGF